MTAAVSFVDERSERLLLGQVLAHEDRFDELTVDVDHFHGIRRELFEALLAQRAAGKLDVSSMPERLYLLAYDLIAEWQDFNTAPLSLRSLESRLKYHAARRRLHVIAETADQLVADTSCTPRDFAERVRELAAELAKLGEADR